MNLTQKIHEEIQSHLQVIRDLEGDASWVPILNRIALACIKCLRSGGKLLLCGNGGSAADAQHIAAELSGRYLLDRDPLFAEALHVNSSYLTAVANDYDFSEVYARAIQAKGNAGDVLIGLTTSGKSPNILKAFEEARRQEMIVIGFTGQKEGKLEDLADYVLRAPSTHTPRIQEVHILFGHMLCLLIEESLFGVGR